MAGPWVRRGKLRDMLLPEGMSMLSAYKVGLEGAKNAIEVPWGSLLIATGTLLMVAGIEYRKGV